MVWKGAYEQEPVWEDTWVFGQVGLHGVHFEAN